MEFGIFLMMGNPLLILVEPTKVVQVPEIVEVMNFGALFLKLFV